VNALRWAAFGLVAVLAAGGGYWLQTSRAGAAPAAAPAEGVLGVSFQDLQGQPLSLEAYRGKLVVLNFWATWCPPCLKEMPAFVRLQQKYGDQGLQFVGIALDTREEVARFVTEHRIDFPIVAGEEDVAIYMQRLGNGIGALPFTVVVDRDGAVRHTHQGEWPEADAEAVIQSWLAPR
jgi:peroxiredoxin